MERKLATIRQVKSISPIKGADAIECITIDGWNVVSKKGEFRPGELCVYFEIDSLLPVRDEFEFLRKSCYHAGLNGFRLKTIKLRGQISQGLALPLRIFPELSSSLLGDDVTELLGVTKYEPPVPPQLTGEVIGMFPSFIPKTDQERIQNLENDLKNWDPNYRWEITEKLDGTSTTVFFNNGEFGVCSRNLQLKESPTNTQWNCVRHLEEKLRSLGRNIAIQGEIIGPGIQKNVYKQKVHTFNVFDMYDIDAQKYLSSPERILLARDLGLHHCPIISSIPNGDKIPATVEELLKMAVGSSNVNGASQREGLVFKCIQEPSISFKAISNTYLLDHE